MLQSCAGEAANKTENRDRTEAKEPVVRGSRDETTAQESVVSRRRKQHGYDDREKSVPNSRRKPKEPK